MWYSEHSLCPRSIYVCITLFNPHNNPMRSELLLTPFDKDEAEVTCLSLCYWHPLNRTTILNK